MAVQRIRVWQWILLSLLVGGVVAWVLTSNVDEGGSGTTTAPKFIRDVQAKRKAEDGRPIISAIVIEPVMQGPGERKDASGKMVPELVQRVRFKELRRNLKTKAWDELEGSFISPVPLIQPIYNKDPDNRLRDWLEANKKDLPGLEYSYAWWKPSALPSQFKDKELNWWQHRPAYWGLTIGMSVLLIGVIWPLIIKLMVKLGLGLPEEEAGVDLSKVRTSHEAAAVPVVDADLDGLTALNAKLEENVAGMLIDQDELDDAEERRAEEAVIRKLEGQKLESQIADNKSDDPKDYQGEFYPVSRPGGKKE